MIHEKIQLFKDRKATLTTYILDDGEYARKGLKRPSVIICPGGGYQYCSKNEGEPVALFFNRNGYNAFVLDYSVTIKNPFPKALQELAMSMYVVRSNKEKWLLTDDVFVIGFSAGGNLAMSLGCYYKEAYLTQELGLDENIIKPSKIILGYPTITLKSKCGKNKMSKEVIGLIEKGLIPDLRGSDVAETMKGKTNLTEDDYEDLNLINHLHSEIPPVFIFGSLEDTVIPSNDFLDLAKGLVSLNIECELHFYNHGAHGVSLCDRTVSNLENETLNMHYWTYNCLNWMKK